MGIAIPERILNYRISATSPTDELLMLRHLYSEVGEYASTILDHEHTALSKKCATRLNKVDKQLSSRHNILSAEEIDGNVLSELEESNAILVVGKESDVTPVETRVSGVAVTKMVDSKALSELTVDELYNLYCGWPLRHRMREAEGREHMTFYYEGKIVGELQRREAANKGERLKIDYCAITYRNELENMAFIFSIPISSHSAEIDKELTYPECQEDMKARLIGNGYIYPESSREYTPSELLALIKLYSHYHDITERELLIEYVDIALDLMEISADKAVYMAVASELVEIGRKGIIMIPGWVTLFLEEAVKEAKGNIKVNVKELGSNDRRYESDLVLPLLTLQMQNGSQKLEREARRLINRCYRAAATDDVTVEDLYMAVSCCDYVSRFSVRKMGKSWNRLTEALSETGCNLATEEIIRLLRVADEIGDYVEISIDSKNRLTEMITERAKRNVIEARAHLVSLSTPMAKAV